MSTLSKGVAEHSAVIQYLERICGQVKAKTVHEEIKAEMLGHLEERIEESYARMEQEEGRKLEAAIGEALKQMGDPVQIGQGLHAAHRPRPEWSVIALVAGMIVIAIVSLFALNVASDGGIPLQHKLMLGFIGVVAMVGLYFVDYRKLVRLSWPLYWATVLLLACVHWAGIQVNGAKQWLAMGTFLINVHTISPYLFMIAFAGMMYMDERKALSGIRRGLKLLKDVLVYLLLPCYFYATAPALSHLMLFGIGLFVLLIVSGRWKLLFAAVASVAAGLINILVIHTPQYNFVWMRLTGWLSDNPDANFMAKRSMEAIRSGGMWGQGFGIAYDRVPFITAEMMFAYLVHSLGWVFGAAIIAFVLMFVARAIRMGIRLNDSYAKRIVLGLTIVFALRFLWNIFMCLGWLPIVGMDLPLIHWSSASIVEFAAVGLMLCAYRRKDMIGKVRPSRQVV